MANGELRPPRRLHLLASSPMNAGAARVLAAGSNLRKRYLCTLPFQGQTAPQSVQKGCFHGSKGHTDSSHASGCAVQT